MSKHKVAELEGALLDQAVARAEGEPDWARGGFTPSRRWMDGGPLIERGRISLENRCHPWDGLLGGPSWMAYVHDDPERIVAIGKTALVAAMRYYVAKKLGEEVELP